MIDDHAVDLRQRILEERDRQNARFNVYSRLLSATNQWLFQLRLRPGEVLQSVTVPAVLAKGQTAAEAIGKLRVEMFQVQQELMKVRTSPLPVAEQIRACEEYVARRGAVNGPRINIQRDALVLSWRDDVIGSKQDMIGVLCWLAPATVTAALRHQIEAQPQDANAMPAADRIAKISSLEAKLLELERRESQLLDDSVLPRPEMSPLAYLQVQIVSPQATAAAA
jgi:hypothetical protein